MQEKLQQLKEIMAELYDLRSVFALLDWDMQVNMPPGGAEDRSNLISTISRLIHERWTADETGKLIEELYVRLGELDPASDSAALLRKVYDEYQKKIRVPAAFMAEATRQFSLAHEVWMRARAESNFELFRPNLERIVDLVRQYAGFFAPFDHIYDPLLNEYERGMKTADVREIFQALRPQQVEIIQAIAARPQVDDAFLHVSYPESEQWDFGVDVITRFGYDWNRGRQDRSTHPFTTVFGLGDIRITTRF
ncbi:MAG: carboxypeptidase M32, partial [Chloroflexi bacterium]|nr:carboxypeptidase M32 [Chloroflexota bacterium]